MNDPAELKKALQEARKEKARLNREGEATEDIRARIKSLEAALDAEETSRAIAEAPTEGVGTAVVLRGDDVIGVVAVSIPPGSSKDARASAIDDALTPHLARLAEEASLVLAADAHSFARERPGRDAEGRTVLDVRGRVEGDRIVPDLGALVGPQSRGPKSR